MSQLPIESITTECPNGHRVRGDIGWLNRDVCCPRCQAEFTFKRPNTAAVEVISPKQAKAGDAKTTPSTRVNDSSVMKILGDFANAAMQDDGTQRHCSGCGATFPSYFENCINCNIPLDQVNNEASGATENSSSSPADKIDFEPINPFPFDDVIVRKVMRPRKEIEFLEVDSPLDKLLVQVRKTRFTRYVVCEKSLDDALGLVHIEDIVLADENSFHVRKILRPMDLIPESTRVSETLMRLQKKGEPIALIIDEFDTVLGMVTVKDIMLKLLKKP